MLIFWLVALLVFLAVEAATVGLVSVWFAFGALAALIGAGLKAVLWVQIVLFLGVSVLALVLTRPLARRYLRPKQKRTNADRVLDQTGVAEERIDNLAGSGTVQIGGRLWSARSENGAPIDAGVRVRPVRIEGVKLIVVPCSGTAEE